MLFIPDHQLCRVQDAHKMAKYLELEFMTIFKKLFVKICFVAKHVYISLHYDLMCKRCNFQYNLQKETNFLICSYLEIYIDGVINCRTDKICEIPIFIIATRRPSRGFLLTVEVNMSINRSNFDDITFRSRMSKNRPRNNKICKLLTP